MGDPARSVALVADIVGSLGARLEAGMVVLSGGITAAFPVGPGDHVSFLLDSWEKVLRAAQIMAVNDVPVDVGPTQHGITRGGTIYAWDPSGNRFETFQGGSAPYPDWGPIGWTWEGLGEGGGLDVSKRVLHDTFLTVVT